MINFENAIEIQNLTKKYDGFLLDAINFHVPKGSIMGFIGQNGAGKTTTIKALLNIIKFDTGKINILGMDSIQNEIEIKKQIAVVFDELPFQDIFNAKQIARILCDVFPEWNNQVYENYLERFQLPKKKKIGQFSKGMKMKLQIATALSHNAKLLIMDEATTGLDPVVRNEILDIFLEYLQDENHSIFMSSHITSDLEKIADSVTFIDKGKILISGYKDEILEQHGMMKCSKKDYQQIDKNDMISARLTDFGAEIMIADKIAMQKKYAGLLLEPTSLEEIMLFYVNRSKKEWS
ncbi:MAG: ABC transporter ATP-binding protein [Ruminococcus sp.]|nr:ABC transporter ATP-binding protein [Ruminococcus sp.]